MTEAINPELSDRLKKLEALLIRFATQEKVDGCEGVMYFDSGHPGPTLGITACTHGNEPSGLAAIEHVLSLLEGGSNLLKGKLYLVVNNVDAAIRYFEWQNGAREEGLVGHRFIDLNMNRLPHDLLTEKYEESSLAEIVRSRKLAPIWERFTVGLDIHSTRADITPMIITGRGSLHTKLVRGFPIPITITHIDAVQIGSPAFGFYGGKGNVEVPVVEIEAGTHRNVQSFNTAAQCAEALLKNVGMIEGETKAAVDEYVEYEIFDTLIFPNDSFELAKVYDDFAMIPSGEVVARGRAVSIVTHAECVSIFPPAGVRVKNLTEEVMFFSRPKRSVKA